MTATTRRPTRNATPSKNWRDHANCTHTKPDDFHDDRIRSQRRARAACHGCTVTADCLISALGSEGGSNHRWGVAGGLTTDQRRALRCEILLGNQPDLAKAKELASLRWRHVLYPFTVRGDSPQQIADALNEAFDLEVSPVTVRVAVWWMGRNAPVITGEAREDGRSVWQLVRDDHWAVVERLRELGATGPDIAAHLGVGRNAIEVAVRAWKASTTQELGVAA